MFREVTISRCGDFVVVVDDDPAVLELIKQYTWSVHRPNHKKIYARAEWCRQTKQRVRILMHRYIAHQLIGPPPHPGWHVDHKDGDGLHNWKDNLIWRAPVVNRWVTARWGSVHDAV